MKAFKGCTNLNCEAYKKLKFKDNDKFCTKCGEPLSYVCADCWKVMADNTERYCTICGALREQKKKDLIDGTINKAAAIGGVVAVAVPAAGKVLKQSKSALKDGKDIVRMIKK